MTKISGARIQLEGRPVRRRDGALVANYDDYSRLLLEPTKEMCSDGHPGPRPPTKVGDYRAEREWDEKFSDWKTRAVASDAYQRAVKEMGEKQKSEPYWVTYGLCLYQDKIYSVEAAGLDPTERALLVKHFALRQQQAFKRISKEIQAFENLERLTHREVIPESVRIFVWQRDEGRCVDCGRRDSLEFDHVIPLADGGASTERNIQLRCSSCNQRKGKNV